MKHFFGLLIALGLSLSACEVWTVSPLQGNFPTPIPTGTPILITPYLPPASQTATFTEIPEETVTPTNSVPTESATHTETPTLATETASLTSTATPLPPSVTATQASGIEIVFLDCNTSLDITHNMGEVTNLYTTIRNHTQTDLTDLCATLSASDEARQHPDKTQCIPTLPAGYQITFKLTVDTGFDKDTTVQVDVTSAENITASLFDQSCREIGLPNLGAYPVGTIEPIP